MYFLNWAELRYAAQRLWQAKRYSLTIIITLGLTVGALLTALQINYQILAAPLPYPEAEQLYLVRGQSYTAERQDYSNLMTVAGTAALYQQAQQWSQSSSPATMQLVPQQKIIQHALVAFGTDVIRNRDDSPQVQVGYISPEYFSLLQVPFAAGQPMQAAEGLAQRDGLAQHNGLKQHDGVEQYSAVVVISDALWQRLYQRSPQAIGQRLQIGTVSFQIIGVTAAGFVEPALLGPGQQTDIWLPWDFNPTYQEFKNWWGALAPNHHLLLRLTEGTDAAQLARQLSLPLNQAYREAVDASPYAQHFGQSRIGISLDPLSKVIRADSANTSLLGLLGCILLLLIAAVNLSQLMLARSLARQQQHAVRIALGAQPAQLMAQAFTELALLILSACLLALTICTALLPQIRRWGAPYLARMQELTLQPWLGVLMLLLLLIAAYWLCWVQQKKLNLAQLQQQLQRSGKGNAGQQQRRYTPLLLSLQASATMMLLTLCLQLGQQAFSQLQQLPGFQTAQIQKLALNRLSTDSGPATLSELLALRDHLAQQAGIELAGLGYSTVLEFNDLSVQDSLSWPIASDNSYSSSLRLESSYTDSQLLPLLNNQLRAGRWFTDSDQQENRAVAIINVTAAQQLLRQKPDTAPDTTAAVPTTSSNSDNQQSAQGIVGQRLLFNQDTPIEIIGVVADYNLRGKAEVARIWLPDFFHFLPDLLLRYHPTVASYNTVQLNQLLAEINPAYRVQRNDMLEQKRQQSQFLTQLTLMLTLGLSLAGLLLAGLGSYGVLSYQIGLQRYELGVRMALGASPAKILRQWLNASLLPCILGVSGGSLLLLLLANTADSLQISMLQNLAISDFLLPLALLLALNSLTTLSAVWHIISQPALAALQSK